MINYCSIIDNRATKALLSMVPCIAIDREHPRYSNARTLTLCGARTGVAERLQAFKSLCGATARVTKCLPAYNIVSRSQSLTRKLGESGYARLHTTGIFERLLDYYSRFWISTRLRQSLQSLNSGCKTCNSLASYPGSSPANSLWPRVSAELDIIMVMLRGRGADRVVCCGWSWVKTRKSIVIAHQRRDGRSVWRSSSSKFIVWKW